GGVQHVRVELGGPQQRLGGNAAAVKAGASEAFVHLDDCGLEAQRARANRRHIATGPRADDHDVEFVRHAARLNTASIECKPDCDAKSKARMSGLSAIANRLVARFPTRTIVLMVLTLIAFGWYW